MSRVGGGVQSYSYLERVKSKTFRLISSPPLTDCVQPLKLRRNVASLSIFYSYFHANCSSDLTNYMSPLLLRPRCNYLASAAPTYSIPIPRVRVNRYSQCFIPFTGKLWNSLPLYIFPSSFDLDSFKRGVSKHLSSDPDFPLSSTFEEQRVAFFFFIIINIPEAVSFNM